MALIDALRDALPLHRCGRPERCGGCAFADLGTCRPDARATTDAHAAAHALAGDVERVLDLMVVRMRRLASQERFEEAAEVRDRGALLERFVAASAASHGLIGAGDVVLEIDRRAILIRDGQLAGASDLSDDAGAVVARLLERAESEPVGPWLTARVERETRVITSWLRRTKADVRLLYASHGWAVHRSASVSSRFRAPEGTLSR